MQDSPCTSGIVRTASHTLITIEESAYDDADSETNAVSSFVSSSASTSSWSADEERMLLRRVEQAAEVAAINAMSARASGHSRRRSQTANNGSPFTVEMSDGEGVAITDGTDEEFTDGGDMDGHEDENPESRRRRTENNVESTPDLLRREFTRVRLALSQNRSAQTVAYMFSAFLPFALLFLFKLAYEKRTALATVILGYVSFVISDKHVVSLSSSMKGSIIVIMGVICSYYASLYYVFDTTLDSAINGLTFQFKTYEPCLTTLYNVLMADLAAKHLTVLLKLAIVTLPERTIHLKRRRRLFQFIEYGSQLYRCAIAAPQWIMYFLGPDTVFDPSRSPMSKTRPGNTPIVDIVLVTLYICLKLKESFDYSRLLYRSFYALLKLASYGTAPTAEEIARDPKCSVCLENLQCPIKLGCAHIFCEECAEKWLDDKHTCPMCRAQVEEQDSSYFNGGTCKTLRIY